MTSEPCDLTAVEQRRLIGARRLSPVELLESCLARIDGVNPAVNAVVAECRDRARQEARRWEAAMLAGEDLPPLAGLPLGVKDLNETEGLRTTFGSAIFADHVPAADERMVAALRAAGAIVVGKTNTPEFGAGANTTNAVYGPTGNPFDPARICGGSSGGSAVALATGMLPLCTGSDTGGSLRTPAAFCGIAGFRPTPGLVPHEKRGIGWTPLSVQGPMARDVPDLLLLLQSQAGFDSRDPFSGPVDPALMQPIRPADLSSLRVAFSTDLGFAPVDARIADTFRDRCGRFASVFREAAWRDPDMAGADEAFEIVRALGFLAAHGANYEKRRDMLGPNIVQNVEQGLGYSAADAARGQVMQTRIFRAFQQFFRDVDVLISPMTSVVPFPVEEWHPVEIGGRTMRTYFHWLAPAYGITLTAHPAISIPCGLDPTGTPFGLQVTGPYRGDRFTLEVAHALELLFRDDPVLARPLPDLAALARAGGRP